MIVRHNNTSSEVHWPAVEKEVGARMATRPTSEGKQKKERVCYERKGRESAKLEP